MDRISTLPVARKIALAVFRDSMVRNREMEAARAAEEETRAARTRRIEQVTAEFDRSVGDLLKTVSGAATELRSTADFFEGQRRPHARPGDRRRRGVRAGPPAMSRPSPPPRRN